MPPVKDWIDTVLTLLVAPHRILEIGSANGRDADYIESRGYTVERTDAVTGFVELLQLHGHQARRLNALTDDFGGPYELIFADAVFVHFTSFELMRILASVRRSLSPNGLLAFSLKEGDGSELKIIKLTAPRFFQYWKEDAMHALLAECGYKVVSFKKFRGNDGQNRLQFIAKAKNL